MEDPETILLSLRESIEDTDAELAATLYTLEDYYERKLWYQLSDVLKGEIYKNPNSKSIRLRLYDNFIHTFRTKINQLQLVEFLVLSIGGLKSEDALEYLGNLKSEIKSLAEKKNGNSGSIDIDINEYELEQATLYLDNEIVKVKLDLGFFDECVSMIDANESKIDKLTYSVDNRVNSSFYSSKALLAKHKGDFNGFYYNSLRFLSCIGNEELKELEHKENIVGDICLSGLLGDKIYNFGEIIMHEIFQYLDNEWLKNMVLSLNNGELERFEKLLEETPSISEFQDAQNIQFLRQKVCIMTFIEVVFSKPSSHRNISYAELKDQIPVLQSNNDIEALVMKCLSLGLIKGQINEVHESVEVTWIQPHTMTKDQILKMKDRLSHWQGEVAALNDYMLSNGSHIYV